MLLDALLPQIKQFTEGNTFVGKDKEILEIQAQNEFMTKLVRINPILYLGSYTNPRIVLICL